METTTQNINIKRDGVLHHLGSAVKNTASIVTATSAGVANYAVRFHIEESIETEQIIAALPEDKQAKIRSMYSHIVL